MLNRFGRVVTVACLLGATITNADEISNYNLLPGTMNQHASWAKLAVIMDVAAAQGQVFADSARAAGGEAKADSRRICFRLGSVLTSIIGSAARYGIHAKNQVEKDEAREIIILGLSAATHCGFEAKEVVNPEYAKMAAGDDVFAKVRDVSNSPDGLMPILRKIFDLNKVK